MYIPNNNMKKYNKNTMKYNKLIKGIMKIGYHGERNQLIWKINITIFIYNYKII